MGWVQSRCWPRSFFLFARYSARLVCTVGLERTQAHEMALSSGDPPAVDEDDEQDLLCDDPRDEQVLQLGSAKYQQHRRDPERSNGRERNIARNNQAAQCTVRIM